MAGVGARRRRRRPADRRPTSSTPSYGSWQWTGGRDRRRRAELATVRALRPRLRQLWSADEDEAVELVNGLLRDGHALPQLVKHDAWDCHLHATVPRGAAGRPDGRRGRDGARRRHPGGRAGPAEGLRRRRLRRRRSSTCPRTGPGGSATAAAATGPTSRPTGRARPARALGRSPAQAWPSKRLVTEPSSKTSLIARAMSGAIESTVELVEPRSSAIGRVLVTMTSSTPAVLQPVDGGAGEDRVRRGDDRRPAPRRPIRASAALVMVPPVSIMSSTSTQMRPSTSPTTRLATDLVGPVDVAASCG